MINNKLFSLLGRDVCFADREGFTIAEIVVAMLVLGGIAMILMPVLFNNAQEQITATSLNKTYSTFQQTARSVGLLISKGQIVASPNDADTFFQALQQTAKVVEQTKNVTYFEGYTTDITDEATNFAANQADTVVLKNGVFVSSKTYNGTNYIVVDTNGLREPNKVGKDIFFFEVKNVNGTYSVHPAKTPKSKESCSYASDKTWEDRIGCTKETLKL